MKRVDQRVSHAPFALFIVLFLTHNNPIAGAKTSGKKDKKRKQQSQAQAARKRQRGGICLSDEDEDASPAPRLVKTTEQEDTDAKEPVISLLCMCTDL